MPEIKAGPLTRAELQAIWEGATDKGYRDPFVSAGEGRGFEAWTQLFAQLERASKAVDVTTQAMFISPWSGQTNPPAAGARKATVTLTFERTKNLEKLLVLGRGLVYVGEKTTDEGESAGVEVETGRRYVLAADLVFHPGEKGPFQVAAEAERVGYGYDNPLPGTIKAVSQPGSAFENDVAAVSATAQPAAVNGPASRVSVLADDQPDMFVPDHVGQYLLFVSGANAGKVGRMASFVAPSPETVPALGSQVDLELLFSVELEATSGAFTEGEALELSTPAGYARAVGTMDATTKRLALLLVNGTAPAVGTVVTGLRSGATGTVKVVLYASAFSAEAPVADVGGAGWRVLSWADDWGLTCTNAASPSGGLAGFLDELGSERGIGRAPGEDDESYRARVREIADVVTPNAIRRALNRSLGGYPWCLREVGQKKFRGLFLDGTNEPASATAGRDRCDACDYDTLHFTGSFGAAYTAWEREEPVVVEDASFNVKVEGYFGRLDAWNVSLRRGVMNVVRKRGALPASLAGLRVRGVRSGQVFQIEEEIPNVAFRYRRFRTLLDYADFRAYFLVGLPKIPGGDFGIAYDAGLRNAYDAAPFDAFCDGYPTVGPPILRRAHQAIDRTRAGGVGFDAYQELGDCVDDAPDGNPLFVIDPKTMGGLVGQWESYLGLTDDGTGKASAWADQSGAAWNWAQGTGANRPTILPAGGTATPLNGPAFARRRPALGFDGAKWLESARETFPTAVTFVFLALPSATDPSGGIANPENAPNTVFGDDDAASAGSFGIGSFFWGGAYYVSGGSSSTASSAATPFGRAIQMYAVTHSNAGATLAQLSYDGIDEGGPTLAWNALGCNRLGVGNGNVDGYKGELYAAMAFDRALTSRELRLLFYRWQVLYF